MMQYNFDEIIERRGTDSTKWATDVVFNAPEALPMWVADMDFRVPPEVVEALARRVEHGIYGYGIRRESFCDSIITWVSRRHGWQVQEGWIITNPGVVPALSLAVQAFTQPGDKVIIQPPVYMPFLSIVPDNGRQLLLNPLKVVEGRYEMDFDHLEKQMLDRRARLMILCSPHNPVGRVWSAEELRRVGELCVKHHIILISDEIHSDLIFGGHKHTPVASLSPEISANTITFMAPSKTFNLAGLTTSYTVITNPELYHRFIIPQTNLHIGANNIFGVTALMAAYNTGEDWLDQLLIYLDGNFHYIQAYLAQHVPQIKANIPEGTYLVWLDCRALNLAGDALKDFFVKKAGVGLNDGRDFGPGGEGFMRLNAACPRATLQQALEQIKIAVGGLSG